MQKLLYFFVILVLLMDASSLMAAYSIKGKLNMKGDWQYQIYMSTIDRLDDYNSANAEYIINVATIDADGRFELKGDNLPEYSQFYKLYLLKEEHSEFNACLFVGGDDHNYVHLLLDNSSEVNIQADTTTFAPFGDYQILKNRANQIMSNLGDLLHPSYRFYEIKFPSELKFSEDKLNKDLFHFADTCSNSLVALAAINNTDYHAYFDTYEKQYEQFGALLKVQLPEHPYTKDYLRKLRYYNDDFESKPSYLFPILSLIFGLSTLFFIYQNMQLRKQLQHQKQEVPKAEDYELTPQEIKILKLIKLGRSNKEIASELFIELSTVKSHINKLYAKIKVKNRKEAIQIAKNIHFEGV